MIERKEIAIAENILMFILGQNPAGMAMGGILQELKELAVSDDVGKLLGYGLKNPRYRRMYVLRRLTKMAEKGLVEMQGDTPQSVFWRLARRAPATDAVSPATLAASERPLWQKGWGGQQAIRQAGRR